MDRINSEGDGTILYPSGRTAVTVCRSPGEGFFHTFIADTDNFQVLACFDTDGVGSVNYPQGNPWLVTTKNGWMLCSREGKIQQKGSWPRTEVEPVVCAVSQQLTVTFKDRQHIEAVFNCANVSRRFQIGEYLRRSEPYAVLGKDKEGHLQLDIAAIRQRIQTIGSVYTPPGPHNFVTPQPGLGNLRSTVRKMGAESPLRATIDALDKNQARIAGLTTLKQTSYGASRSSSRPGSSTGTLCTSSASAGVEGDVDVEEQETPYGCPVLTPGEQRIAAKLKRIEVSKPSYTIKRIKLPLISVKQLQKLLDSCPSDMLIAVCLLASWNPVCTKLEHYQLQAACWELQQQQEAVKQQSSGNMVQPRQSTSTSSSSDSKLGSDSRHLRVYKVDGSESRELQGQYGFRSIPMFLMFYEGKLVSAGNSIRTKDEFLEAAAAALTAGRRRSFLPEGFKFTNGDDNAMLDSITKDMSLLGGVGQ